MHDVRGVSKLILFPRPHDIIIKACVHNFPKHENNKSEISTKKMLSFFFSTIVQSRSAPPAAISSKSWKTAVCESETNYSFMKFYAVVFELQQNFCHGRTFSKSSQIVFRTFKTCKSTKNWKSKILLKLYFLLFIQKKLNTLV